MGGGGRGELSGAAERLGVECGRSLPLAPLMRRFGGGAHFREERCREWHPRPVVALEGHESVAGDLCMRELRTEAVGLHHVRHVGARFERERGEETHPTAEQQDDATASGRHEPRDRAPNALGERVRLLSVRKA